MLCRGPKADALSSGWGPDTVTPLVPGEPPALTYTLPKFKLAFAFEPLDFTQVNNEINQKMVTQALALLAPTPGMKVLDLFCGLGNFTLPLARLGADVQGFEGSEALVARARSNAERNGLGAVPFAAADLYSDAFAARHLPKAEAVLLDPPALALRPFARTSPARARAGWYMCPAILKPWLGTRPHCSARATRWKPAASWTCSPTRTTLSPWPYLPSRRPPPAPRHAETRDELWLR